MLRKWYWRVEGLLIHISHSEIRGMGRNALGESEIRPLILLPRTTVAFRRLRSYSVLLSGFASWGIWRLPRGPKMSIEAS